MRSMFADHPCSEVVKTHGESAIRLLTTTFSVLSPRTSFISLVRGSNSAFNSSNFFFSSSSSMSKTLLGRRLQLLSVKLLQLLHRIFIDGICHVQHLKALLPQGLQKWRRRHCCNTLTCDVVYVVLAFLHAVNILLEPNQLITRFGGMKTQQLCFLGAVGGFLMHTKLQAFAELLIELLVVILLFRNLCKHL